MSVAEGADVIHPDELRGNIVYEPKTAGKHFVCASTAHVEKYGSCDTNLATCNGEVGYRCQLAAVKRPLHCVARVTGPKDGPGRRDFLFDNERCVVVLAVVVKQTLQKESQSPGRIEDSIARCVSIQLLPEHADTWLAC